MDRSVTTRAKQVKVTRVRNSRFLQFRKRHAMMCLDYFYSVSLQRLRPTAMTTEPANPLHLELLNKLGGRLTASPFPGLVTKYLPFRSKYQGWISFRVG